MNITIKILLFLSLFLSLNAEIIVVDKNTSFKEILPHSQIYIDDTKILTLDEVKLKKFKDNKEEFLAYGYSPPFAVWVKFTLENTTDKTIHKILQYDHEITTDISFFDEDKIYKEGIYHVAYDRDTINPIFHIELKPNESKTYFLKAESIITPLIVKLNLWNEKIFYSNEIDHQFMLAIFFGAMGVLFIYNIFIFFFTRDISYLYYVLYIFGVILHHLFYIGVVYKFNSNFLIQFFGTYGAYIMVTFPFIMLGLFTKYFLNTKQYPMINKILNFYTI